MKLVLYLFVFNYKVLIYTLFYFAIRKIIDRIISFNTIIFNTA